MKYCYTILNLHTIFLGSEHKFCIFTNKIIAIKNQHQALDTSVKVQRKEPLSNDVQVPLYS